MGLAAEFDGANDFHRGAAQRPAEPRRRADPGRLGGRPMHHSAGARREITMGDGYALGIQAGKLFHRSGTRAAPSTAPNGAASPQASGRIWP